jgi:hypothetical protein
VETSVQDYQTLETPPADRTEEPDAEKVPGTINIVSDEVEVATEEDLRRVIEEVGKLREPEIPAQSPDEAGARGVRSYIDDHPTNFDFRADVARLVNRIQQKSPWQTFANTYYWHPPYDPPTITVRYDAVSVDFWGGGLVNGKFAGYRGKPIGTALGHQVWNALFYDKYLPAISWIIWNGRMWVRGSGWRQAPGGPADSDAGHYNHIHVTYV